MSEKDTFLASVAKEGEDAFPSEKSSEGEKETPPTPPVEDNKEKDKPPLGDKPKEGESRANTEEKDVPFHKHPRWTERERELEELRAVRDDYVKFKEEVGSKLQSKTGPTEIPEWFKELYGENQSAWDKYSQYETEQEQRIEQRLLNKQAEEQIQKQKEVKYWQDQTNKEITRLQSEGKTFDRNEFLKFLVDYQPIGEDGLISFTKGYELFEKIKNAGEKEKSDAKKSLADITNPKDRGGSKGNKDYLTSHDLRRKSWSSL